MKTMAKLAICDRKVPSLMLVKLVFQLVAEQYYFQFFLKTKSRFCVLFLPSLDALMHCMSTNAL